MKFIEPNIEKVRNHRYSSHENKAINIYGVMSISKSHINHYPDNKGIPTLRFWFNENMSEDWYFDTEEERDRVYKKILRMGSK